jgi:phage gpG-like protein
MPEYIDIKVDTTGVEKQLKRMSLRSRNIDMNSVAEALSTAIDDVITSEGKKGRQRGWKPFSKTTLEWHPNRIGGKLLQGQTGILAAMETKIDGYTVVASSPAPYAKYHQTGTTRGKRPMPRRDPFAIVWGRLLEDIADMLLVEVTK